MTRAAPTAPASACAEPAGCTTTIRPSTQNARDCTPKATGAGGNVDHLPCCHAEAGGPGTGVGVAPYVFVVGGPDASTCWSPLPTTAAVPAATTSSAAPTVHAHPCPAAPRPTWTRSIAALVCPGVGSVRLVGQTSDRVVQGRRGHGSVLPVTAASAGADASSRSASCGWGTQRGETAGGTALHRPGRRTRRSRRSRPRTSPRSSGAPTRPAGPRTSPRGPGGARARRPPPRWRTGSTEGRAGPAGWVAHPSIGEPGPSRRAGPGTCTRRRRRPGGRRGAARHGEDATGSPGPGPRPSLGHRRGATRGGRAARPPGGPVLEPDVSRPCAHGPNPCMHHIRGIGTPIGSPDARPIPIGTGRPPGR